MLHTYITVMSLLLSLPIINVLYNYPLDIRSVSKKHGQQNKEGEKGVERATKNPDNPVLSLILPVLKLIFL